MSLATLGEIIVFHVSLVKENYLLTMFPYL